MSSFKPAVAFLLLFALTACCATEIKEEKHENIQPEDVVQPVKTEEPIIEEKLKEQTVDVQKTEEKHDDVVHEVHDEIIVEEHVHATPEHVHSTPEHVHETPEEHPKSEPQKSSESSAGSARQFMPMYQPMFPPPSSFNMIRRQFGGGMELLGDIVMMGMIGLPILGLLTVGSSSIANFLGFGSASSSKSSSKRNKRSLKEKAAGAVEYAKDLWEVMEQLERAFEKYDLYQAECRLRAVCEVHHKVPRMGAWGQTILDLMR